MEIENHLLKGEDVVHKDTPNKSSIIDPKYLVFHFTAGRNVKSSVDWLCDSDANASAHLVIGRDGSIFQLAPFNVKTWHAGRSKWENLNGMNNYSIGIEMDNAGRLTNSGSMFRSWFGELYSSKDIVHAAHKNTPEKYEYWQTYTKKQITIAIELSKLLTKTYNLEDILGHDDVSPKRKIDPGPAFPMENIKSLVYGRRED